MKDNWKTILIDLNISDDDDYDDFYTGIEEEDLDDTYFDDDY